MKYALVGPALYMDKVGSLYVWRDDQYVPVQNKVTEAEDRYVSRHKGGKQNEKA